MLKGLEMFFGKEAQSLKERDFPKYVELLSPFFPTQAEAEQFVLECEEHKNPTPKRILHQIHRHISMSDEVQGFKTPSVTDSIKVFFWIVCIEAIYKASNEVLRIPKAEIVREFFSTYVDSQDQQFLTKNVKVIDNYDEINIDTVANMLNTVRNVFAHEGVYWLFTLPVEANGSTLSNLPKAKTAHLSTYTMDEKDQETYLVSFSANQLRDIIIKGSLNYLRYTLNQINTSAETTE